ncbi:hypothetical protein L7F22_002184 [Adiantum nelumboides]|nr:hypothetical protein [Adiantum nelumboides]
MARTKETARKAEKGPSLAKKACGRSASKKKIPGKPMKILKGLRMKTIQRSIRLFSDIKKAQKCIELCVPKLPFQRAVRKICEEACAGGMRWKVVSLLCLQEAVEDFLLEYFNDNTIVAAHAHRVTIMDKDSEALKRVHWRYNKLLIPNDFIDPKMMDILLIPPGRGEHGVRIHEATHEVNTRARAEQEENHYMEA